MLALGRPRIATLVAGATLVLTACAGGRAAAGPSERAGTAAPHASSPPATSSAVPSAIEPTHTPTGTLGAPRPSRASTGATGVPRFAHIVVVVEENKPYGELVGSPAAPFLTALAAGGALLTQSYGITHPSEPNYLALFSGSTQGLTGDSCPHRFTGPNLAAALLAAGDTFVGYSESLPSPGYQGCYNGAYARKHSPWVNFAVPAAVNQPMSAFPADFNQLPSVSFVIPNLQDDMHDGTIAQGDQWLAAHLGGYRVWAASHNSLLVVTTDEDDESHGNHITTILAGAHVKPGQYATRTDHYGLLRTLLDSFSLTPFAAASTAPAITAVWAP